MEKYIKRFSVGKCISAGKMRNCVKVRVSGQKWDRRIQKYYKIHKNVLVRDPNSSVRTNDVVRLRALNCPRISTRVRYIVSEIITPFGSPLSQRPCIPTEDELKKVGREKRMAKDHRQSERNRAIARYRVNECENTNSKAGASVSETHKRIKNTIESPSVLQRQAKLVSEMENLIHQFTAKIFSSKKVTL